MVKVSEILKELGLTAGYTERVTNILRDSFEYGGRTNASFLGATVDADLDEVTEFVRNKLHEKKEQSPLDVEAFKSYISTLYSDALYIVNGAIGRILWVYEDKCVIYVAPTIGAALTGNVTDGVKSVFYHDCIGVQYKEPGATLGYLQLETASGLMNNSGSNLFNENTFTFEREDIIPRMREVYEYVCSKVSLYKQL